MRASLLLITIGLSLAGCTAGDWPVINKDLSKAENCRPQIDFTGAQTLARGELASAFTRFGERTTSIQLNSAHCIEEAGQRATYAVVALPIYQAPYPIRMRIDAGGRTLRPRLQTFDKDHRLLRDIASDVFVGADKGLTANLWPKPDEAFLVLRSDPAIVGTESHHFDQVKDGGRTRYVERSYVFSHFGTVELTVTRPD